MPPLSRSPSADVPGTERASYQPSGAPQGRGPFVPILLVMLAFLGWTVFQASQLISERGTLIKTHADQTTALEQAQKVRAANDSLAGKTQKLADTGNVSAQAVVAQLKQRGITINPNAATQAPPK